MPKAEPTYEELKRERAEEWRRAQVTAAANLAELHKRLADMPDVKDAPSEDLPWSHPKVVCACGGRIFRVTRPVTVNGRRYRFEVVCADCSVVGTWDWGSMGWL